MTAELAALDADPGVEAVASQPMWLHWVSESGQAAVVPLTSSIPASGEVTGRTVGGQGGGELTGARGAHPHSAAGDGVDDLLDRPGGDDATAADHQEMVGGLGHLAHQVRGEEEVRPSEARARTSWRTHCTPSGRAR